MNELNGLWKDIKEMEHGTVRKEMLKSAIKEADRIGDYDDKMKFRLELMEECCFYGDDLQVLLLMPEVLQLYDGHIVVESYDVYLYDIIWNYKWVLSTAVDYYQVSREQFEAMAEDFKRRCLENGYSLRAYHAHKSSFYRYIDKEIAEKEFQMFLKTPRDSISDCKACEQNREVSYYLFTH